MDRLERVCALLAVLATAAACAKPTAVPECPEPAPARELSPEVEIESAKARSGKKLGDSAQAGSSDPTAPNRGMHRVEVLGVVQDGTGREAVLLARTEQRKKIVPIWIGPSEAAAIALRLAGERFPRPLTTDLLERVMLQARLEVARVEIDALEDHTFLARLFVIDVDRKLTEIDARPSDSIALAVGAQAPIFMAQSVIDQAGERPEDLGIDPDKLRAPGKRDKI